MGITASHPVLTHLQEGRLLQHAEELWEIIPDLLVHSSHQADLSHRPGSVCTVTVRFLHLQRTKGHEEKKQKHILDSDIVMLLEHYREQARLIAVLSQTAAAEV